MRVGWVLERKLIPVSMFANFFVTTPSLDAVKAL
jgi:hypothetical protein